MLVSARSAFLVLYISRKSLNANMHPDMKSKIQTFELLGKLRSKKGTNKSIVRAPITSAMTVKAKSFPFLAFLITILHAVARKAAISVISTHLNMLF